MIQDQYFFQAASSETRVMLSWHCVNLLASLPCSAGTISKYIKVTFKDRVQEIMALIASAANKITFSMDIWAVSKLLLEHLLF